MSRINRKNWTNKDIGYLNKGGVFDMFDNLIKSNLRINDDELDFICINATDDELGLITIEKPKFSEKKQIINLLNKYINYGGI